MWTEVTKTRRKYYTVIHSGLYVRELIMGESEDRYNQDPSSAFFVRGDCQLLD